MRNHRTFVKDVITFLICTVMSACTGIAPAQPSPFPSPVTPQIPEKVTAETKTPTVISATVKPSLTLTSTALPTLKPTSTPLPSQTATISPPTDTLDPQSLLTEQAFALKETQIAGFSITCGDYNTYYASVSPAGNWVAISCKDQTLQIYSKTGKKWVAQFKDFVAKKHIIEGSPPKGGLYPMRWTSDEKYLYFTPAIGWSGGGICFYRDGVGEGLYRFNVNNGTVAAVLPLLADSDYAISFSPDGRWLTYNAGIPTLLNLQTGNEIILQGGENVGDFTWSPDGSNLAYSACQILDARATIKSSIKIFSLKTHQSKTILEIESGFLRIDQKDGNKVLKIYDDYTYTVFSIPPEYLFYDWSGQLITPTSTP